MSALIRLSLAALITLGCWLGLYPAAPVAHAATSQLWLSVSTPVLAAVSEEKLRNVADQKLGEAAGKIDLNNTNIRAFRKLPGMYPTLASKIVKKAPFESVDDVLKMRGLSDRQKATLEKYLDQFTVTPPSEALNYGDDRINPGIYR